MAFLAGHNFVKGEILTTRDSGSHEVEYRCKTCGQTITLIDRCNEYGDL